MKALQIILVLTSSWDTHSGELYRFERKSLETPFELLEAPFPCVVGQKGMGWGIGAHAAFSSEKEKKEGDRKAPAGTFELGPIFVDQRSIPSAAFKMPAVFMDEYSEAVDDPSSLFYNQLVDARCSAKDWTSSEKMQRDDELYLLGLVIQHNPVPAIPGRGSCIFMHSWRGNEKGTYGCTALSPSHLLEVLTWLDPAKSPLLIQLPWEEYQKDPTLESLLKLKRASDLERNHDENSQANEA